MSDVDKYRTYAAVADNLLQAAKHDELFEALKIFALNLSAYKAKFSEIPQDEILPILRAGEIGEGLAPRLTDTMAQFIGVMRTVIAADQEERPNSSNDWIARRTKTRA